MVGVEVPEPGVDVTDTSDSVRLSVFKMEGCVCGRSWKIGAAGWADWAGTAGAEFHDPSKYKLIAAQD